MGIKIQKSSGISLKKGNSISLKKEGKPLHKIAIGLNWGKIDRSSTLTSLLFGKISVDLDASAIVFDQSGHVIDLISYKKLKSNDGAILHSGDDLVGDSWGDDGEDNELITINIDKLNSSAFKIVFFLNSFKHQDFSKIPYSKISLYEGNVWDRSTVAHYNLAAEEKYNGHESAVMAELRKVDSNNWVFKIIGEPTLGKNIRESVQEIREQYLN